MNLAPPTFAAPESGTATPRYLPWSRSRATRTLVAAGIVGVSIDQVVHTRIVGLAGCVMVLATAAGLLLNNRLTRQRAGWLTLVLLLTPALAVRSSPWLTAPTLVALAVLMTLAAGPDGIPVTSFPGLASRMTAVVEAGIGAPHEMLRASSTLAPADAEQQVRRSLLGLLIAGSVGLVLIILLISGDAYFASFIGVPSLGRRLFDALIISLGAVIWLSLIIVGRRSSPARPVLWNRSVASSTVGTREVVCVLGCIAIVLGVYVASLIAGAIGGAEYIERSTGLTYAEYARSGFFQLVAVVAIVGSTLVSCRRIVAVSAHRRGLLATALCICVLTLVMVAVSIARLQTYRGVFGLTMLRFTTTVFAVWLGVVIVLIAVSLMNVRLQSVLVVGVILSAYATLMVTNWLNPEAIVTRENVERIDWSRGSTSSARGAQFDGEYLVRLSDDAVPALISRLDLLPNAQRSALVEMLCDRPTIDEGWSWNRARAEAGALLDDLCGR